MTTRPPAIRVDALLREAVGLQQRGQLQDARLRYENVLRLEPDEPRALHLLGLLELATRRTGEAVALLGRAAKGNPQIAELHCDLGVALLRADQPAAAQRSFDRALALKPDLADAHHGRGMALYALGDWGGAVAAYDRAIAIKPSHAPAHHNRGDALHELEAYPQARASYETALALQPENPETWSNVGVLLQDMNLWEAALEHFERALAIRPEFVGAAQNHALALLRLKRFEQAVAGFDRVLELEPTHAAAYLNRGHALAELKRHEDAIASYERARELDPGMTRLPGACRTVKMQICDWRELDADLMQITAGIERNEPVAAPFTVLGLLDSPALHLQAARIWAREEFGSPCNSAPLARPPDHERIRLGYFSGDLRDHAVAILAAELIEAHDRSGFHVTAYSLGPNTQDAMRRRLEGAFDRFVDAHGRPDEEIALLARADEIDVAIDLGGFTTGGRPRIFALRAAPVQVGYLGYPGTLGASLLDYVIADRVVIPPGGEEHFQEKLLRLPESYLPHGRQRIIDERPVLRSALGLPESAFVFCSFNNTYKIMPATFDAWMRILDRVNGSVLWLSAAPAAAIRNLQREARRRGIDPARLIFATRLAFQAEHLGRLRAADLFLDTLPYNAHSTACDALWAGLPVLSLPGRAFPGRVAASVLSAIRLPELIANSPADYERRAIEFARDPQRLQHVRERLAAHRLTAPLFDIERYARQLETGLRTAHERYRSNLAPDHIQVLEQEIRH